MVLENEIRITGIFTGVLASLMDSGDLPHISPRRLDLVAHNISVLGHMWTFRRWFLANHYSIDEYIGLQTRSILGMCRKNAEAGKQARIQGTKETRGADSKANS